MEQLTGAKLEKEYVKAVECHPAYLTSMQGTSCEMQGWMEHNLQSRLVGECSWYHFNGRNWRETKKLLDEGERGEWKSWIEIQYLKN